MLPWMNATNLSKGKSQVPAEWQLSMNLAEKVSLKLYLIINRLLKLS